MEAQSALIHPVLVHGQFVTIALHKTPPLVSIAVETYARLRVHTALGGAQIGSDALITVQMSTNAIAS